MTHECPKKLVPWLLATTPAGSQPRETPCPKSCCVDPVDVDPYFHELRYRVKQKLAGIRANTYGVSRARLHVRRKPTVYRSVHTRRQLHKFSHRLAAPSFSHLFSLPTHAMLPLMQRRVVARQRPAMVVDRMRVRTGHGGSSQPPLSTHSHNISFGSVLAGPPFVLERGAPVLQLHGHERGERGGTSLVHRRMIVPAALTSSDPRAAPFIASGSASKCAVLPGQQSVLGLDRASGTDVVGSRGSALSRHRQRVAPSHDRASGIDVVGSQGSALSRNGGSASPCAILSGQRSVLGLGRAIGIDVVGFQGSALGSASQHAFPGPRAAPLLASGSASQCAALPRRQSVLGLDRASGVDVVGFRGSGLSRRRQRPVASAGPETLTPGSAVARPEGGFSIRWEVARHTRSQYSRSDGRRGPFARHCPPAGDWGRARARPSYLYLYT